MYCPNCATPTQVPEQNYCKNCGTNLLVVTQALTVSGPSPNFTPFQANTPSLGFAPDPNEAARRKFSKIGWAMVGGGILLGIFMAILGNAFEAISGRFGHFIGDLASFGPFFMVAGIFLLIYNRIIHRRSNLPPVVVVQQNPAVVPNPVPALPQPPAQSQFVNLPPAPVTYYDTPPSVTENTTAHLNKMQVPVQYTSGSRDTK